MKKGLLDTNFYTAFKRNNLQVINIIQALDYIGVDVTVLAELYSGFKLGSKEKININELEKFLNTSRVHILNHDINTANYYAYIFKILRIKGNPIPTNDIWIAAVAMQHGLTLCTMDNHFEKIDGLILHS